MSADALLVERCLRTARWEARATPRQLPIVETQQLRAANHGRRCHEYDPNSTRKSSLERTQWRMDDAAAGAVNIAAKCARLLSNDALDNDFDGEFASNSSALTVVQVIGDSIADQLVSGALSYAIALNPNLGNLHVKRDAPAQMPVIPRSVQGCVSLLNTLDWSPRPQRVTNNSAPRSTHHPHVRRVLMLSLGQWYNLAPANDTAYAGDTDVGRIPQPNHNHPASTPAFGTRHWPSYAQVRRARGMATALEWSDDVATLLDATTMCSSCVAVDHAGVKQPPLTVVWVESPPQHFPTMRDWQTFKELRYEQQQRIKKNQKEERQSPQDESSSSPPPSLPPGVIGPFGCSIQPVPFSTTNLSSPALAAQIDLVCANASLDSTACRERLGDWRNVLARPAIEAHNRRASAAGSRRVHVAPLASPLMSRSELHPGEDGMLLHGNPDCTHFCDPSEATVTAAAVMLNVIAQAVDRK